MDGRSASAMDGHASLAMTEMGGVAIHLQGRFMYCRPLAAMDGRTPSGMDGHASLAMTEIGEAGDFHLQVRFRECRPSSATRCRISSAVNCRPCVRTKVSRYARPDGNYFLPIISRYFKAFIPQKFRGKS